MKTIANEIPIGGDRRVVEGRVEDPVRTTNQSFAFVDETFPISGRVRNDSIDEVLMFFRLNVKGIGEIRSIQLTSMIGCRGNEDVAEGRHGGQHGEKTDQEELTFLIETK